MNLLTLAEQALLSALAAMTVVSLAWLVMPGIAPEDRVEARGHIWVARIGVFMLALAAMRGWYR